MSMWPREKMLKFFNRDEWWKNLTDRERFEYTVHREIDRLLFYNVTLPINTQFSDLSNDIDVRFNKHIRNFRRNFRRREHHATREG